MAKKSGNGSGKRAGGGKRRSKGEDSTGAKEAAVEMRKGGELDLKPIVIDDSDFDLHFRATKNAKERVETSNSLYRSCLKNAKKVSPELHDAIKDALAFEGMEPADIKRKMEISGYVLRKTGSAVQLTIHDTLLGDVKQAAGTQGYRDAKAGRVAKSPYPESSDLHALYMAEWQRGTRENLGMETEGEIAEGAVKGNGIGHNSHAAGEAASI